MDVVPPGEQVNWQTEPFSPVEKDGKIFARGAADDKGGLMAMLIACLVLQEMQPPINGTIELCGVMGEETGGMGTTYWVKHLYYLNSEPVRIPQFHLFSAYPATQSITHFLLQQKFPLDSNGGQLTPLHNQV